jgi:hypothetical protein
MLQCQSTGHDLAVTVFRARVFFDLGFLAADRALYSYLLLFECCEALWIVFA